MDQGAQSLIVYATLYGAIVGWDIRIPGNAWRMESDLRNGVITTFCIDPSSSWLAIGTSSGRHVCWDLRFNLKIAEIKHPHEFRIRRVACHPTEPSCLISASQGNKAQTECDDTLTFESGGAGLAHKAVCLEFVSIFQENTSLLP